MARPLRISYAGACYYVTARGNARQPIARDDDDRQCFLERLAATVSRYRLVLHAYVLMRNHYHLLVETPEANLSPAMRQLNGVYTQDFNRRHRRAGHLFQGRYKALLVDKASYLVALSRHLHLNPVRVGDVSDATRFRWSSAAAYVGTREVPKSLTVTEVLRHCGSSPSVARRRYREFLQTGAREPGEAPWSAVVGQTLLGEERWVERMRRRVARGTVQAEASAARRLRPRPSLAVVIARVSRAARVRREEILQPRGTRGGWARMAAIALGWELGGLSQPELAEAFGISPFAVSKAIRRLQERLATEPKLAKQIAALTTSLQG